MLEWLIEKACAFDGTAAEALGWSPARYAIVSSVATAALAWGFLATWLFAFGRLRSAGLAKRQQRLVWWFVFSVALLQIALAMSRGVGIDPFPCPWAAALMPILTLLFLARAYGHHIEDENRASLTTFARVVALPVLGEAAITAKWTVSGLISLVAWLMRQL